MTALAPSVAATPWLRNRNFDLTFVVGTAAVALASGMIVVARPSLFGLILFLDIWLLGYHHIFSTYSRIADSRASLREHRFLTLQLPFLVLGGVGLLVGIGGTAALAAVYFYWQWLHYTRQSYGVERMYGRKEHGGQAPPSDRLMWSVIYVVPFAGLLHRSAQAQDEFLGGESWWIPVPSAAVVVGVAVAAAIALAWVGRESMRAMASRTISPHTLYVASHLVIFSVGYGLIEDVTHGWLVINVWHNAQYVLVVWMYNRGRYKNGVDPEHSFVSGLSQPGRVVPYFAISVGFAAIVYLFLGFGTALLAGTAAPALVYMSINFHHYIVDSVIWKTRKATHQQRLGLSN